MKQRCCALFRGVESFVRRHLYMVCRRAIEGPVASDCDANAARLHDQIGLGNALDDRLRGLGLAKLRDSVELRSVEDDIGAEQRDGSPVFVVAPDFELLVEEDDRALFAFADLPATPGRLPVAHPARIASECARRHRERKRVDSAIGATRDGVHWALARGAFPGVPGPPPGEHSILEFRDDGVRQLFVVVAPSDVVPQCLHWTVLSPFLDLNSPSRVASRSPAQGREARTASPAKRLDVRTLAAGDGDAIAAPSLFLLLAFWDCRSASPGPMFALGESSGAPRTSIWETAWSTLARRLIAPPCFLRVRTFRRRTSRLTLWTGEAGGVERAQAEVGASHDDLFACRRQLGWPLNCADNVRSPGTTNETGGSDCGRWWNVTVAPRHEVAPLR